MVIIILQGVFNMKKLLAFLPVLLSVLILGIFMMTRPVYTESLSSGGGTEREAINVSGSADVMVAPDEVVVTIGIETKNKDVTRAKEENDAKTRKILDIAKKSGIDSKNIQMDYINISPCDMTQKYVYDSYYTSIAPGNLGYGARKKLVVTITDLTKFEGFLTEVVKNGVEYVQGVEFKTSELRKNKDKARELAVKAAREKADAMTAVLGQKAGKAVSITEVEEYYWSWYNTWYSGRYSGSSNMLANSVQNVMPVAGTAQDAEEIAPGQIKVTAKVSISFELN